MVHTLQLNKSISEWANPGKVVKNNARVGVMRATVEPVINV